MGMPAGLAKATNYYNRLEAWNDWKAMVKIAENRGLSEQASLLAPADDAGWRTIDKQIQKLRKLIKEANDRGPAVTIEDNAYEVIRSTQPALIGSITGLLLTGQSPEQIVKSISYTDVFLAAIVEMALPVIQQKIARAAQPCDEQIEGKESHV